jgi:hypothetical protein
MASNIWILALYGVSILFTSAEAAALRSLVTSRNIKEAETKWGAIWTAAPQLVETENLPPAPFVRSFSFCIMLQAFTKAVAAIEGVRINKF